MVYAGRIVKKKGQATLEFTLMFVIMVTLVFGILGLWKWSVGNFVNRQTYYNSSRLSAGTIGSAGEYSYQSSEAGAEDMTLLDTAGSKSSTSKTAPPSGGGASASSPSISSVLPQEDIEEEIKELEEQIARLDEQLVALDEAEVQA